MKFALPNILSNSRLLVATLLVTTAGCSTTTPTACDSSTLQQRGYAHALQGSHEQSHTASNNCSRKAAPVAYRQGFDYGLEKYCTFKRGLWYGEMGKEPAANCSDTKWDEYESGYLTGREIYDINSKLEAISKELDAVRSELWELESTGESQASPPVQAKLARIEELKDLRERVSQDLMNLKADTRHPEQPQAQ